MTRTLALTLMLALPVGTVLAQSYSCSSPNTLQTFTNNSPAGTTTGTIQSFSIPAGVASVTIDALGAQGGVGFNGGGRGAEVVSTVSITPGQTLCILVGAQGGSAPNGAGGGGGGSFVYAISSGTCASNLASVNTISAPQLLAAAGGGGGGSELESMVISGVAPTGSGAAGASSGGTGDQGGGTGGTGGNGGSAITNSGGGGGLLTNGASANTVPGGSALVNGGTGGVFTGFANGGFGGGGAAAAPGGGGGGYNGGGGGGITFLMGGGGGGGSYSITTPLSPYTQSGVRNGNGLVTLCYLASGPATHFSISAPSPVTSYTTNQITVIALDASNNTAVGYTGTVHLTSTDPGFVNATGDATLTNGVGTFNVGFKQAGSQTITATDTVNSSITGTSGSITVNPGPTARFVVSAPATTTAGSAIMLTISPVDLYGNTTTYWGTGHFSSTDGAAVLSGDTTLLMGPWHFPATLNTPGPQTITVTDPFTNITGTSGSISVTGNSSTALAASPSSGVFGQPVTFTATVTSASGHGTPIGAVTFRDGSNTLGTAMLVNGTAAFTVSTLSTGSHSITAVYGGNSYFTGSTSGASTQTVIRAASSTVLASAPNPSVFGQSVTLTATVTAAAPGSGTPTGSITFRDGSTTIGTASLFSGSASFTTSALTTGSHSITAVYGGDSNFSGSTASPSTQAVNQASSTTALVASPNPATFGQSVTFTATVTAVAPGSGTPTGTVTFKDGSTIIGSASLSSGSASFTTSALTTGSHSITAVYGGDSNFSGSTSGAATQTVNQASSITALVASPNPSTFGQSVTFTATVTAVAPGSGTPTGSVTFKDGSTTLGSATLSGGMASFSTSALSASSHAITAVYGGDTNFSGSTSSPLTQTVNSGSQTITFAALPGVTYGAPPLTLTATANSGLTVAFASDTPAVCSVTGTGVTVLAAGTCSITATQSGNSSYTAAAPITQTFTVNKAVLTVTANYATSAIGQPLPAFSAAITGFVNGDTAAVVTGAPTLTTTATPNSPPGNYPLVPALGTLAAANYSFTFVNGTLVLTAQPSIVINTAGTTPGGGGSYYGESFTTPGGGPWTNITFSFFSDQGVTPTAAGTAYLFTVPYTGTPAGLAASGSQSLVRTGADPHAAAGFLAASTGISSGAYVFPASVVLQPNTQYYVYANAPESNFPGGILTGGAFAGATLFVATGSNAAFTPVGGAANFRVAGSLVPPASSVTLTASPNPAMLGQTVTFTASVGGNLAAIPIGAVQFQDGGAVLGTVPLTNGTAVFRTAALAAGSHTITANYAGGGIYPPAQASAAETVNPLPSTVTLTANATAPVYGQPVTLTAVVGPSSPPVGFAAPTGQVNFYLLGAGPAGPRTLLGSAPLASGGASYTISNLPIGTQYYLAQYSGDSTWSSSVAQIAIAVSPASSTGTVSLAVVGGKLMLSAAVAAASPGAGMPTGSVQFIDTVNRNVVASATLANGSASVSVSAAAASTVLARPIAAVYSGDGNFNGGTSAPLPAVTSAAANLWSAFAPDEIVSLFGVTGLSGDTAATLPLGTSLAGVSANVTDSGGTARPALLYGAFASAGQVNLILPAGAATGMATLGLTLPGGAVSTVINLAAGAPAIFTANANGQGVFAGQVLYVNADGSQTVANPAVWQAAAGQYVPNPISLKGGQVYLVLYGTGLRHAAAVTASVNGVNLPVVYSGPQVTYPGLDQINLGPLPASLAGAGTITLAVSADGQPANAVTLAIQ